ncbi:MAG: MFS transporter [Longilinea sp.]|nr:MFS transporter [Longilinea sp.]
MKRATSQGLMVLSCASFLALGIVTASVGPALSDLAQQTNSDLTAVGSLFTALFLGSLAAQGVTGLLLDRLGPRGLLVSGLSVLGLGVLGMTLSGSLLLAVGCAALAGLGHGTVDVTSNVMISDVFPQRRAAALNWLNMFYGVGAFVGPAVAGVALRLWGKAVPALWLGAGLELLLAPVFLLLVPARQGAVEKGERAHKELLLSPLLWSFGVLLLVYVGVENGVGGWVSTYLGETTTMVAADAALVTSLFWLALTVGRFLATLLGVRVKAVVLLGGSLSIALLGALLFVAGQGHVGLSVAAVIVLGLGFAPIFPTAVAMATAAFRQAPGAAASVLVALGSVGGMVLPWLQGVLLLKLGALACTLVTLGGVLLMGGCFVLVWIWNRKLA